MSDSERADERAHANFWSRYLPTADDDRQDISGGAEWGPYEPGDYVIVEIDADAHVVAGASGDAASTTRPKLPAGLHDFVIPVGTSHVILDSDGATATGAVWKAS